MGDKRNEKPARSKKKQPVKKQVILESDQTASESEVLNIPQLSDETQNPASTIQPELPVVQPPVGEVNSGISSKKSISADTHSKKRKNSVPKKLVTKPRWRFIGFGLGILAIVGLIVSASLGQFYKNKTMPNVEVLGQKMGGKSTQQITELIQSRKKDMKFTLKSDTKKLEPSLDEIGYNVDIDKTVKVAMDAKRTEGFFEKLKFWQVKKVAAVTSVNDTLLSQYIETNIPEIVQQPVDATLAFNPKTATFSITNQASGKGADLLKLEADLVMSGDDLKPVSISVKSTAKGPNISEAELKSLVEPANSIVKRKVTLSGQGYSFTAKPSDIASWVTPTPRKDASVRLVIDPAKIQSYVDGIAKRISSPPQDTKVLRDEITGQEVVLQEGRDGTELADKEALSKVIATSLSEGKDVSQPMNIQVAVHKTVSMSSFDKWIEVDLSEQRTTAYERANPLRSFTIASGMRGYETVKGEFAIWHKNRSQTMQGGSKADGSYYSIPNVEWVSYFYKDYALHGAWWREKFGYPASHGCVNMTNDDARWVYEWAPIGTKVIVHD
jgi:hypothetical protein